MSETLGQQIGVVGHALKITNDQGDKVQLSINIDFTSASVGDIKSWLVSNRTIAAQRPWRAMGEDELKALDGQTFIAANIGRKVKTEAQTMAELESMASNNPTAAKALLEKLLSSM